MLGTGEYTTGYVDGKGADSDKSAGVVALCMLDLQLRGKAGGSGCAAQTARRCRGSARTCSAT